MYKVAVLQSFAVLRPFAVQRSCDEPVADASSEKLATSEFVGVAKTLIPIELLPELSRHFDSVARTETSPEPSIGIP